MVKRLLAFASVAVVLLIATAPVAFAQGKGQGGGNSESSASENSGSGNGNPSGGKSEEAPGNSAAGKSHKGDEDVALEAVQSDDALPLQEILQDVRHGTKDKIIDAQLFSLDDELVYEVKVLATDGHVTRLYFHAKSGRQLILN